MSAPLPEWRKDRIKMAREVWDNILDPIMTFAELVRGYNHKDEKGIGAFNPEEISSVLRLLVIGGYTETKLYCSTVGGSLSHVSGDSLEEEIKDWETGEEEEGGKE